MPVSKDWSKFASRAFFFQFAPRSITGSAETHLKTNLR